MEKLYTVSKNKTGSWLRLRSAAAAAAKSLQSCPTLCDPIDSSPSGFPVPGILQARTLEWVAISFSNAWKWKVKVKSLSHVWLLATPWTAAYEAPPSMGFSRQEYWSGVPLPSPLIKLILWVKFSTDRRQAEDIVGMGADHKVLFYFTPNEYSGLISFRIDCLDCPRNSQESSPTPQFKSISSSALSLLYGPALTSIHNYWKNHSFDYTDLCWQRDISLMTHSFI